MLVMKEDMDNNHVLNIFTDASIYKTDKYMNACSGAIIVCNDTIIENATLPLYSATNNRGELTAILLGLTIAMKHINPNIMRIQLFSDSKISIFGLREWIYNWIHNSCNGVLMSTSGEVKNQDLILLILNMISNSQIPIVLYHVRGHHNENKYQDIINFKRSFTNENHLGSNIIEDRLCKYLIKYNNMVDELSRTNLDTTRKRSSKICNLNLTLKEYIGSDLYNKIYK